MGGFDEVALDYLSLVTEMTRHIHVRAAGGKVSASKLGQFSPIFIWLPRVHSQFVYYHCRFSSVLVCETIKIHFSFLQKDFYLDWVEDNRKITPRDYLQLALRPVQGGEKDVAAKNEVTTLHECFVCFTML